MLQSIRDNTQGLVAKIIIGFVIVTFAIFGVDAIFNYRGAPQVAEVNGQDISEVDLQQAILLQKRQMMARMGDKLDPAQLDDAVLRKPALEGLVEKKLLLLAADELGMAVPDAVIDPQILATESFQKDGVFSQDQYAAVLRSNGFTPRMYKQLMKEEMTLKQLASGLAESEFISAREAELTSIFTNQSRDIAFLTIPKQKLEAGISVSDDEIRAYYESHKDDYFTEEKVAIEFIELAISDFFEEVSEDTIRARYEEDKAAAAQKVEKQVAHILVEVANHGNEEEALNHLKTIRARIMAGEDFAKIAREVSEDVGSKASGGDLGVTDGTTFPPEFESAIAGLRSGDVSEPFKTSAGYHLAKVVSAKEEAYASFDSLRSSIKEELQKQGARSKYVAALEKLGDLTFTASDLTDALKEFGKKSQFTEPFGRHGGTGIAKENAVVTAAFSDEILVEGNNSSVIELGKDKAIVLRLKQHLKPELQALDVVRTSVADRVRGEKTAALIASTEQDLLARIRNGEAMADVAKSAGFPMDAKIGVKRTGAGVPYPLLQSAFEQPTQTGGLVANSVKMPNGDLIIYTVGNVVDGTVTEEDKAQSQMLRGFMARAQGMSTFETIQAYIKSAGEVIIH